MKNIVRFTFRLPDKLYKKLKGEASDMGMSLNSLIIAKLWKGVKNV